MLIPLCYLLSGFQARLLHRDFTSIEETFAITPASSVTAASVTGSTTPTESVDQEAARKAKYPGIFLNDYSPALQAKALKAVRRGAIYVQPCTSKKPIPYETSDKSENVAEGKKPEEIQDVAVEIDKSTKLLLAFRAISPEHDNAEKAAMLDDIAQANLTLITGKGISTSGEAPVAPVKTPGPEVQPAEVPAPTPAIVPTGPIPPLIPYAVKEAKGSLRNLFRSKKHRHSVSAAAAAAAETALVSVEKVQPERQYMIQLYLDNKLVPLAAATDKEDFKDTIKLKTGALLDLGVVGKDLPDAPAKEILHTITMHLWDASREEIVKELEGKDVATYDLKKAIVPDVIFHFEIVSSGPTVLTAIPEEKAAAANPIEAKKEEVKVEAAQAEEPKEQGGVFVEQIEQTSAEAINAEVADDNIELRAALVRGERLGPLPPVAEEASSAAAAGEEEKKADGTFKAKLQKTWEDAMKPIEPLFAPLVSRKKEEKSSESNTSPSCFRTWTKRMSMSSKSRAAAKGTEEAQATGEAQPTEEELKRKRRASMPDFSSMQAPLRRMSLNKSRRSRDMSGEEVAGADAAAAAVATRHSVDVPEPLKHAEISKTMKRADQLKKELAKVELEKRKLEHEWDHCLLENADERVHLLEKRLEEGKREVREMRKRVLSRPSPAPIPPV